MRVCTLASSSSGNCTVVFSDHTKILIDAGLKLQEIILKLELLKINPEEIFAILLTHEHSDHIKSIGAFMRKFKDTKLFVHKKGFEAAKAKLGKVNASNIYLFDEQDFFVNQFKVKAFELPHDASMCVGYNIFDGDKKISIATDLGHATEDIVANLHNSKLVILESNHDEKMLLRNDNYSALLKSRILGKNGHLSNMTASKIICELAYNNVKQVILAHLSEENNTPELAFNTAKEYLEAAGLELGVNINIDVACHTKIGRIYHLN